MSACAQPEKPFPIPVNYFGIVLGLVALGLAWRYATGLIHVPALVGEVLIGAGSLIWLALVLVYIVKWVAYRDHARAELCHDIAGCFVSLIPITGMLVGLGLLPYAPLLGRVLIYSQIVCQILFSVYRLGNMMTGTHPVEATTPVIYLPMVATNFVSATSLGTLGYPDWGLVFFGMGFFGWIVLEPAVLSRLRNLQSLPVAIRPAMGIQAAPGFVGAAAYMTVNGGLVDALTLMLIGYGLVQLFIVTRLLLWASPNGFTVGLWAYSFGLASMAMCGLKVYQGLHNTGFGAMGLPMFWVGSAAIGLLILCTILCIFQGKFLVRS
ncbi:MAG: dicarboxylate transporter/tellurite-resistance protein TehA [Veillonella sp.]|nr:dicarboxylate transporter/tellurite-resistance protein TehA [Veillonella sp.]